MVETLFTAQLRQKMQIKMFCSGISAVPLFLFQGPCLFCVIMLIFQMFREKSTYIRSILLFLGLTYRFLGDRLNHLLIRHLHFCSDVCLHQDVQSDLSVACCSAGYAFSL